MKRSEAPQPLTSWRAENRRRQQASNTERHRIHSHTRVEDRSRQQARNAARQGSCSLPSEPRTGVVSRLETQRKIAATHELETEDRRHQQA